MGFSCDHMESIEQPTLSLLIPELLYLYTRLSKISFFSKLYFSLTFKTSVLNILNDLNKIFFKEVKEIRKIWYQKIENINRDKNDEK